MDSRLILNSVIVKILIWLVMFCYGINWSLNVNTTESHPTPTPGTQRKKEKNEGKGAGKLYYTAACEAMNNK